MMTMKMKSSTPRILSFVLVAAFLLPSFCLAQTSTTAGPGRITPNTTIVRTLGELTAATTDANYGILTGKSFTLTDSMEIPVTKVFSQAPGAVIDTNGLLLTIHNDGEHPPNQQRFATGSEVSFPDGSTVYSGWFVSLVEAVDALGLSPNVKLVQSEAETLGGPVVIPSGMTFTVLPGAILTTSAANTLTFAAGSVIEDNGGQMFSSLPGEVLMPSALEVRPEWWGAIVTYDTTTYTYAAANQNAIFCAYKALSNTTGAYFIGASKVKFKAGNYVVDDGFDLTDASLSGGYRTIIFEGEAWRTTYITLYNDSATYLFKDDDTGNLGRSYEFRNFQFKNTIAYSAGVSWHPATAIQLKHCINSKFENLYFREFTEGMNLDANVVAPNVYSSIFNQVINCKAVYCKRGFTLGNNSNNWVISDSGAYGCYYTATPLDGWGWSLYKSKGVSFLGANVEAGGASPGFIITASSGVTISGGDIETFSGARSILVRGDPDGDLADIRDWSTGIVISGVKFWNALGVEVRDGVKGLTLTGNAWTNSYPASGLAPNPDYSFRVLSTSSPKYIQGIEYDDSNAWHLGIAPTAHLTVGMNHAVRYNGQSWKSAANAPNTAYGTWKQGTRVMWTVNPAFYWTVKESGTLGTLNTSLTTATGTNGATSLVLSSATDAFPGMVVDLTMDDASTHTATIGTCNYDTLACSVYPALDANITAGAVAYHAPVFVLEGEDNTSQSLAYATPRSIDLSLGGVVQVGELTGDIELSNPTNGLVGTRFIVVLYADATPRSITYGTAYRAGAPSSIAASQYLALEFMQAATGAGGIRFMGVPLVSNLTDFDNQTAWRVFYSNGSGDTTELALGADGTYLRSNGAAAAPTFDVPAWLTAASVNDVNTGTSTTTAVTPDALAGSNIGTRMVHLLVTADDAALVIADTSGMFRVPAEMNGMVLVSAAVQVGTVSSANNPTFKVEKFRLSAAATRDAAVQMLSTNLTIDATEYDSKDATTPAVISAVAGAATVATGDTITASCVTEAGTGTEGGAVTLGFRLP